MKLGGRDGFLFLGTMAPRDRKAIVTGLAILVPALLWVFAVRPYRAALGEVRDQAGAEEELLTRELALLASADRLHSALGEAETAARGVESRMLHAPSLELAEGELSDFLEAAAFRSRVLLEEIRGGELGRGEEPPPGLAVVRLHLRGESDLEGVLTFLDEIERSPLLLQLRGLALEPQVARAEANGREGEPEGAALPTGVVEFQLILDGFSAPEVAPGSPGALPSGTSR